MDQRHPLQARAKYETALARAHRAMYHAEAAAEEMGSPGATWDCHLIALELTRLANDSLSGKARKLRRAQSDAVRN